MERALLFNTFYFVSFGSMALNGYQPFYSGSACPYPGCGAPLQPVGYQYSPVYPWYNHAETQRVPQRRGKIKTGNKHHTEQIERNGADDRDHLHESLRMEKEHLEEQIAELRKNEQNSTDTIVGLMAELQKYQTQSVKSSFADNSIYFVINFVLFIICVSLTMTTIWCYSKLKNIQKHQLVQLDKLDNDVNRCCMDIAIQTEKRKEEMLFSVQDITPSSDNEINEEDEELKEEILDNSKETNKVILKAIDNVF